MPKHIHDTHAHTRRQAQPNDNDKEYHLEFSRSELAQYLVRSHVGSEKPRRTKETQGRALHEALGTLPENAVQQPSVALEQMVHFAFGVRARA